MSVNQLSVFLQNEPGQISSLTNLLRDNDIDLRALTIAETEKYGVLRIIVDDFYKASDVIKKAGFVFRITQVLAVPLKDSAGALADVMQVLADASVNVEYIYAFTARQAEKAYVVLRVADNEKATMVLSSKGYAPLNSMDEINK